MSMTDSNVEAGDAVTVMSVETRPALFSDTELISGLKVAQVLNLTPTEAREVFTAAYSLTVITKKRVVLDVIVRNLINPFLRALPKLVDKYGRDNVELKKLMAEICTVIAGIRCYSETSALLLLDADAENKHTVSHAAYWLQMTLRLHEDEAAELNRLAKHGDFWSVLGTEKLINELNLHNPIKLFNGLMEFCQYASSVSFKTKLDVSQRKMLEAFFRAV